jgi:uncharacterized protein
MSRPRGIAAIDTLIGFRSTRHSPMVPALRGADKDVHHPHNYMFKDIPPELSEDDDSSASVGETLAKMDICNVARAVVHVKDPLARLALSAHPDRFIGALPVDANDGMTAVRQIVAGVEEFGIRAVTTFPSGLLPQVPINDRKWYPIYAKCIELDLPVFVCVGVPGPRVPMAAQYVGLLDDVCYDLPELKIIMRHGAEPWEDLAVKLMLKWPNLYYSTSAFAPKYYPKAIIDYANSRGGDKVIYAGYFPMGLDLERIFNELNDVPFKPEVWPKFLHDNAAKVLGLAAPAPKPR